MFPLFDVLDEKVRAALGSYDDFTAALLARRGITTPEDAEAYLSPSYDEHIHDPLLIKNMPRAAERLARAIDAKEKIAVWSDYDCDGIPGGVVLHDFLKKAGANFVNYIPHRHNEGYGVNIPGIEKLAREGSTLIITVDSGITDNEAVARANELGMDVIITDHHLPTDTLPPAYAVVDPKQEGETYPYRELCGAGLAWKLACATLAHGFIGREAIPLGWEKWLLDMAGLATIADMVPLTGENRVIATYGLMVMRKSPRLGLQKLCKNARVNQRFITEDDVGFMIAPRVNAASRMGDPRDAFDLFTTTDEGVADELAKKLESINRSRRATAAAVTKAVHERLEKRRLAGETLPSVIAMGDPDWRPGLLGLVANSIAEEFERPVFLWGREGSDTLKGSCRGGPGKVHIVELMKAAGDTFLEFGGHAASGGFSLAVDQTFTLEERLADALTKLPPPTETSESRADRHMSPEEATVRLLATLEKFAPYGMGNPRPAFAMHNVLLESVSWFGKGEEHIRLKITRGPEEFPETPLEAMAFYARRELGAASANLAAGSRVNILGHLERDTFTRGQPVRMRLIAVSS